MFDTHCHLNFSTFKNNFNEVITNAHKVGVHTIVIPGTDYESSKRAVEIAEKHNGIYAAIGIHPHHIYEIYQKARYRPAEREISSFLPLLKSKKVVAIGEIGIDRHIYQKTVYKVYKVEEEFIKLQKEFLKAQIELAIEYGKSIILHNRQAKNDLLEILLELWDKKLEGKVVFHCCEPDEELLTFAKEHNIFIGVDGDVTYDKKKQEFVKRIPIELLVLETDSPYLLPEPLRSKKLLLPAGRQVLNEPKNIPVIAEYISKILNISMIRIIEITTKNAQRLFQLKKYE